MEIREWLLHARRPLAQLSPDEVLALADLRVTDQLHGPAHARTALTGDGPTPSAEWVQ